MSEMQPLRRRQKVFGAARSAPHLAPALAIIAGFCAASAASAEEPVEELVVTATRFPTPIEQVSSAITVLSADTLEQRQVRYLSDALRAVPGAAVSRSGGPGSLTQVRFRGTEANHTLVLIDGVEANDAFASEFNFGDLLVDDVERVEVLRGAHSALYGSDAIGGVISIISRRGVEGFSGRIRTETGTIGSHSAGATLNAGRGPVTARLSLRGQTTRGISQSERDDGNHEEDNFREGTLSSRIDYALNEQIELGTTFRLSRSRTDIDGFAPPLFVFGDTDEHTDNDEFYGVVWARMQSQDGRADARLVLSLTDTEAENYLPGGVKGSFSDSERAKVQLETGYALTENVRLLAGVERESERVQSQRARVNEVDDRVRIEDYFVAVSASAFSRLYVTAGVRLTHHEEFGSEPTGTLGVAYLLPKTGTKLKLQAGTGFKAPTLSELFVSTPFFVGNPDLDPEQSAGASAGFEQTLLGGRARLDVQYFENRVRNLILSTSLPDFTFSLRNVARSSTRGVETTLAVDLLENVDVVASYTITKTRDSETHRKLVRRPSHIGSVVANVDLGALDVNVGAYYTGRQDDLDFSTFPSRQRTLSSYWLVNVGVSMEVNDRLRLYARVENVNDKSYTDVIGFGALERTGALGIEWSFD